MSDVLFDTQTVSRRRKTISLSSLISGSKAVLLLLFHLSYVRCCSIFKCFNFNISNLFNSVKVIELPPVWGRAVSSSHVILLFLKICLSTFPFDVWDKLWVLIGQLLKYLY